MGDDPSERSGDQPTLDDLISLKEAAQISRLSQGHLGLLIRNGVIWGKKIGRNWVTTRQALHIYLSNQPKPGPKLKKKP